MPGRKAKTINTAGMNSVRAKRRCSCCVLGRRCLPADLTEEQTLYFENTITRSKSLELGDHLFRVGDTFQSIYAIHSGCFKSYTIDQEGR